MKLRNFLIVFGILLILFNGLGYLGGSYNPPPGTSHRIAYLIGWNIFNIAGLLLLLIACIRHRRMTRKKKQAMLDDLLRDT